MILNRNYKVLIISAIGIIGLVFSGIPNILLSKISPAEKYKNINSEYKNMYENLNMRSIYEERQNDLLEKVNKLDIDVEIKQDHIINLLGRISEKNNIQIDSIKFSEKIPLQDSPTECMKVTLDFNSTFDDMVSFIDDIKRGEWEISLFDISILLSEGDRVGVTLNLMFYALPMNISR